MEVTLAKPEALINTLTVRVVPADYQNEYTAALKDYTRRAALPGFRAGKVPASLVRKRFGPNILAEQLNRMVGKEVSDYISAHSIQFLGKPYLVGSSFEDLDPNGEQPYDFIFELGLEPQFELNLAPIQQYTRYKVAVADADVDQVIGRYRYQLGQSTPAEKIDILSGVCYYPIGVLSLPQAETDAEAPFMRYFSVYTAMQPVLNRFLDGKMANDKIEFVPKEVFQSEAEGAALLRIELPVYRTLQAKTLQFEIRQLMQVQPAELTPEFFAQMLGGMPVADEAEFRAKLTEKMLADADNLAEAYWTNQLRTDLLEANPFELPDRILQRWLYDEFEDFRAEGAMAQRYPSYRQELRFHLIKKQLQARYPDMALSKDEVRSEITRRVEQYLGGAGLPTAQELSHEARHTHEHEHEAGHQHDHDHDHDHAHEHAHDHAHHDHAHDHDHAHTHDHSPFAGIVDNFMQNEQLYQREYTTLHNKRFYEVLQRELVTLTEQPVSFTAFEQVIATDGR